MNKLEKANKNDDEIFKEQIDQNIMIITIHFERKQLGNKSHKSFISDKLQALVDSQRFMKNFHLLKIYPITRLKI